MKKKSFTLIEVLVSVFIVSLVSSLAISNYRASQQQLIVDRDVETLISALREAQSNALAPVPGSTSICAIQVELRSVNTTGTTIRTIQQSSNGISCTTTNTITSSLFVESVVSVLIDSQFWGLDAKDSQVSDSINLRYSVPFGYLMFLSSSNPNSYITIRLSRQNVSRDIRLYPGSGFIEIVNQ